MKHYICESCGARLTEDKIKESEYPDFWNNPKMIEAIKNFKPSKIEINNESIECVPEQPKMMKFHITMRQKVRGCSTWEKDSCYPLHEETEQEYFVHHVGGSFLKPQRKFNYDSDPLGPRY